MYKQLRYCQYLKVLKKKKMILLSVYELMALRKNASDSCDLPDVVFQFSPLLYAICVWFLDSTGLTLLPRSSIWGLDQMVG